MKTPNIYEPKLTDKELMLIEPEQAKFIYNNAKNILIDIECAEKCLNNRADVVFKYFCTFIAMFFWLCLNNNYHKNIIMYNNLLIMLIGISTIILIPIMIYCRGFLLGKITNTIHNSPENTITKRALHTMQTFYIVEAIDIQKYAIPQYIKRNQQTAKWLKCLTISSLLCTIALVVFFISINLSI